MQGIVSGFRTNYIGQAQNRVIYQQQGLPC